LLRLLAPPNSLPPALILARQFVVFWCTSFANSPKAESAEEKRLFSRSVFGTTSATGTGRHRQAGMHRGLSCGIHFRTGLYDVAHDDGFHLVRANAGARNRGTDRGRAKIRSRYRSAPSAAVSRTAVRTASAKTTDLDFMTNLQYLAPNRL
jgi:hypothetical protein